jgi:ubiquinone/menaquinone biosynthesis C-methylase UbiE
MDRDDPAHAASPFFSQHAHAYATSPTHAAGPDLALLVEWVAPADGKRALDVGTGTGHTAVALARRGARTTGVDPTPAMLAEAEALAAAQGVGDLTDFVLGVAEALPFGDASVDIVTCRRAAHHFRDIRTAVAEMARVLRPGGRLGISDLSPRAEVGAEADRFEQLRDPTHVHMLSEEEWRRVLEAAGLRLVRLETTDALVSFGEWLRPVAPDGPEGRAILEAMAALGPETLQTLAGGADTWRKRRVLLLAQR